MIANILIIMCTLHKTWGFELQLGKFTIIMIVYKYVQAEVDKMLTKM